MDDDDRNVLYQDYTASCLGMIGKSLNGDLWKLPSFVDLVYPEQKKAEQTKDEIINNLLAKLGA